jgi:hypothetical protein
MPCCNASCFCDNFQEHFNVPFVKWGRLISSPYGALREESNSMSSNVRALEGIRALQAEIDRPGRPDVEAAFRTIIRWAGDDPEREGLIETPARMARTFE